MRARRIPVIALVSALLLCAPAHANPSGVLRLLVPVSPGTAAGAFGSNWRTTLSVYNSSPFAARVVCSDVDMNNCPVIAPMSVTTFEAPLSPGAGSWLNILLGFGTPSPRADELSFDLRTSDAAHPANAPTELPLPTFDQFMPQAFVPNVALDRASRVRLRVYSLTNTTVHVVARGNSNGLLLFDELLTTSGSTFDGPYALNAATAELPLPSTGDSSMRVEVESGAAAVPLWFLVTTTNDETGQFTTASPHRAVYFPISVAKVDAR